MAETPLLRTGTPRAHVALVLVGALALAALAGVGGVVAALAGVAAQPLNGLGLRALRGSPLRWRDALPLAALWAAGTAAAALLLAWPVSALLQGRSLGAALLVSAVAGGLLVGLWRTWPLWHGAHARGGALQDHWRALADADTRAWRGLAAGLLVAWPIATVLLLAWPGLLADTARWGLAGACALTWPLAHWQLQRLLPPDALSAEALLDALAETAQADLDPAALPEDEDARDDFVMLFVGPTPAAIMQVQRDLLVQDVINLMERHFDGSQLGGVVSEIDKLFSQRFDALVNSLEIGKPPRGLGGQGGSGHGGGRRPRHLH